jgi:hypothetical protein
MWAVEFPAEGEIPEPEDEDAQDRGRVQKVLEFEKVLGGWRGLRHGLGMRHGFPPPASRM